MLNFDKYREEVEKRAALAVREGSKNPMPAHLVLNEIIVWEGLPYMKGNELVDWLFEEYEPPLLENGDGLKPGDWIMVRNGDGDKWQKRRFMCYSQSLDSPFVTLGEIHSWYVGEHKCWEQARLPEDGE